MITSVYENEIIRSVLRGKSERFEALVSLYEKNVYNLALRMVGNPEDAEDMTQETFIKAYKSLATFRGDGKFSVWLYRIATNVCLDFLRRGSHCDEVSLSAENSDGEETSVDIPDVSFEPEKLLMRKLTREDISRGLAELSPEMRQILILREINGLSYAEIAQVLGTEEGTVKSRIFRARKKLCAFLSDGGNISANSPSNNKQGGAKR